MRKFAASLFLPVLCAVVCSASGDLQSKIPPIPAAVTDNAVVTLRNGLDVYSIMGIGPKRTWDDVTSKVWVLHIPSGKWMAGRPVPGVAGRLGASAASAKDKIYLFGGFTIDGQGNQFTVPDVNMFFPKDQRWYRGADIPIAVDNTVIGLNHDRFVYLIGGRSKDGPINNVQVYDTKTNKWKQATPYPGTPVYGHAGGLAEDTIVVIDGAKKNTSGSDPAYVPSDECWMGKIDKKDPYTITWSKLPPHPGPARFGIVAGAREKDRRILFSGGSPTVHNYKGLDAAGKPVEFTPVTFAYNVRTNQWEMLNDETKDAHSDSHGIVSTPIGPLVVGGLGRDNTVSSRVLIVPKY
jgi:N-acetylneuraminic acid mutarotase